MTAYYSRLLDDTDLPELHNFLAGCQEIHELIAGQTAETLFMDLPAGKTAEDKFLIGIFVNGRLGGILKIIRDFPENDTWKLLLLFLTPELRNQGLGRRVYDDTEEWAVDLGARRLDLEIPAGNQRTLRFWQKMGFRESHAENSETMVLMSRRPLN